MTGTFLTKKETRHLHNTYALYKIKAEAKASAFILSLPQGQNEYAVVLSQS